MGFSSKEPAPEFTLDEADYSEALFQPENSANETSDDTAPIVIQPIEPMIMLGQLKPIGPVTVAPSDLSPKDTIEQAHKRASVAPKASRYVNAIQIYPYTPGSLYQVYTAPEQVTDIALQPGETLSSVSAGDTVRWILGDTVSGSGPSEQVHILVKPIEDGLNTNMVIATSRRTYHLEMQSFPTTYMAAVSWRYPQETIIRHSQKRRVSTAKATQTASPRFAVEDLNFRYRVEGDTPHWRPLRAFDDGKKVFIQFPARLDQGEAPPLFVVGHDGESQLINYRIKGAYYEVDRLFGAAELRLGEDDQQVVRITRTKAQTVKQAES